MVGIEYMYNGNKSTMIIWYELVEILIFISLMFFTDDAKDFSHKIVLWYASKNIINISNWSYFGKMVYLNIMYKSWNTYF